MDPERRSSVELADELPSLAVVIPFAGRDELLGRCLEAVAGLSPPPDEVVVVGDGEDPASLERVVRKGWRLLTTSTRVGAAAARNLGAAAAEAELLLFVDADVVVPPDTVGRVARTFAGRPEVAAVFGSYDDDPPAPGLVSRFKNLLHHWTHQQAAAEAATFWTGCGAVRRRVFSELGGFDPGQQWLEDVELGYRMRAAGHRVHLDRSLQVSHLKRWTLTTLVVSDVCHRALPWSELAARYHRLPKELNGNLRGRLSAGLVAAVLLLLGGAVVLGSPHLAAAAAAAVGSLLVLDRGFYRLLLRRGGLRLLAAGIGLHWLYLLWGGAAFAAGSLWWLAVGPRRVPSRGPTAGLSVSGGEAEATAHQELPEPADPSMPRARRRSA